jgi:hypothetical protein
MYRNEKKNGEKVFVFGRKLDEMALARAKAKMHAQGRRQACGRLCIALNKKKRFGQHGNAIFFFFLNDVEMSRCCVVQGADRDFDLSVRCENEPSSARTHARIAHGPRDSTSFPHQFFFSRPYHCT